MFCTCCQVTNIYLPITRSLTLFNSIVKTPLPNLGFSLAGFTTFHSFISKSIVTAALYGLFHIRRLRKSSAVRKTTLGYLFPRHEHYNHLRLCEHGLSSRVSSTPAFVYILIVIIILFFCLLSTIHHLF